MDFRENMARSKEVMGAMWRQGLHELGAALYGPGTAAQPPDYGMPHTKTPGEVAEGRRAEDGGLNEEPRSILGERMQQAEMARDGRAPESPSMEKE